MGQDKIDLTKVPFHAKGLAQCAAFKSVPLEVWVRADKEAQEWYADSRSHYPRGLPSYDDFSSSILSHVKSWLKERGISVCEDCDGYGGSCKSCEGKGVS